MDKQQANRKRMPRGEVLDYQQLALLQEYQREARKRWKLFTTHPKMKHVDKTLMECKSKGQRITSIGGFQIAPVSGPVEQPLYQGLHSEYETQQDRAYEFIKFAFYVGSIPYTTVAAKKDSYHWCAETHALVKKRALPVEALDWVLQVLDYYDSLIVPLNNRKGAKRRVMIMSLVAWTKREFGSPLYGTIANILTALGIKTSASTVQRLANYKPTPSR